MNAERLHAVCLEVNEAIESEDLVSKLSSVTNALQDLVNQPAASNYQMALSAALDTLYASLRNFPTDDFSPAWRQVLYDIGGADVLGRELEKRVRAIIERNQITPATALEEVRAIDNALGEFKAAVVGVLAGFKHLRVGMDELAPGQCEVGVLVPRAAVCSNIREFGRELRELDLLLGTFTELSTGDREPLEIRTITSLDFMLFMAATSATCASIAYAAERIINVYKSLLEIKKLRTELADHGLTEGELSGVTSHANGLMEREIETITIDVVNEYAVAIDDYRRNELTNSVRISLRKLANRIDRGYNIEVRVGPDDISADPTGESQPDDKTRAHIDVIRGASETLQFIKQGPGTILSLPEGDETGDRT